MIDSDLVSVLDYQYNGKTKLYDVSKNKVCDLPPTFAKINSLSGNIRSRTFSSIDYAFSLSKTEQSLVFHFNNFKDSLEIINHDCMDFVFYQQKGDSGQGIKVLSFLEQNDQLNLTIDFISKKQPGEKMSDRLNGLNFDGLLETAEPAAMDIKSINNREDARDQDTGDEAGASAGEDLQTNLSIAESKPNQDAEQDKT